MWKDTERAARISKELASFKKDIEDFDKLDEEFEIIKEVGEESEIEDFGRKLHKKEIEVFLSGKYDRGDAVLQIMSGAGGQDAQDWATILLRMYERYCEIHGYKTNILSQSLGEGGGPEGRIGIKHVAVEVKGNFAYGFLKKETGVHRLVRLSPFSAKSLRHTSFALVEVLPDISESESEIKIDPEELKTDFYRSSGPGGQNVNKRETAVRITHIPTGIVVTSQSERIQGQNREKAMKILLAKLYQFEEAKKTKELKDVRSADRQASPQGGSDKIDAGWSNQIRNYVLHPYKMVKDLRTDVETSQVENVLDGDLDKFIEAEVAL